MLLLNSKNKTICVLKQCIKLYNNPMYFGSRYICFMMFHNVFHDEYNKDIILTSTKDIDEFVIYYYKQIYKEKPIDSEWYGYFESTTLIENREKRIQFLKETIKQINKQYKTNKS